MAERVGFEERKALRFIARREERGDPSPGVREIGCAVGLESVREVQEVLSRLDGEGYLLRDSGWRRMLELTERGWRIARGPEGAYDSGEPAEHMDYMEGDGLLQSPDGARRRILRPEPESLMRAGMSGDELVVIEEGTKPGEGEMVAALVGGEIVLRRIHRGEEAVSLLPVCDIPADPNDAPAPGPPLPAPEARIQGRVVYVIRPL
ncbi:LexA family protein [Rubrobacter aplysinae]|uniref:LexA family protein n=1 Tax=Rubrobacter aplysinae TaxID=909625 RepID=UPI00064BFC2A|nr:S24 family peptidase [Rubrobacter aplysinae]